MSISRSAHAFNFSSVEFWQAVWGFSAVIQARKMKLRSRDVTKVYAEEEPEPEHEEAAPSARTTTKRKPARDYASEWPPGTTLTRACTYAYTLPGSDVPPLAVQEDSMATLNPKEYLDDVALSAACESLHDRLPADARARAKAVAAFMQPQYLAHMPAPHAAADAGHLLAPFDGRRSLVVVIIAIAGHYSFGAFFVRPSGEVALILHFDSLSVNRGGHHDGAVALAPLTELLAGRRQQPPNSMPAVIRIPGTPQQPNLVDCGPYAVLAASKLINEAAAVAAAASAGDSGNSSGNSGGLLDVLVDLVPRLCAQGARPQDRAAAVAEEHRRGRLCDPTFLTKAWFTHQEAFGLRELVADELLALVRRRGGTHGYI